MLRFPRDPNPSKIVKDLERLLKYSVSAKIPDSFSP
jgi:hypothetical protein